MGHKSNIDSDSVGVAPTEPSDVAASTPSRKPRARTFILGGALVVGVTPSEPSDVAASKPSGKPRARTLILGAALIMSVAASFLLVSPTSTSTLSQTQGSIPVGVIRTSDYSHGHYIVTGDSADRHYYSVSSDLQTWRTGQIPGFKDGFSITTAGTSLVALEMGPSPHLAVSADWGKSWNTTTLPAGYEVVLDQIGTLGNALVLPGFSAAGSAAMYTLDEGKTWVTSEPVSDRSFGGVLALDENRSVAIYTKTTDWNGLDLLTFSFSEAVTAEALADIASLPMHPVKKGSTELSAMRFAVGNGRILATAGDKSSKKIYLGSSSDGINWETTALPSEFNSTFDSVQGTVGDAIMTGFAADRFVLIRVTDEQVAYTSRDGITWLPVNPPLSPAVRYLAQYEDGQILATTFESTSPGSGIEGVTRIACSWDGGKSWTNADQPFGGYRALVMGGQDNLLLANDLSMAYTSDCKKWATIALTGPAPTEPPPSVG